MRARRPIGWMIGIAAFAASGLLAAAAEVAQEEAAAARAPVVSGYFSVQQDLRLCPTPVCGGVFVSLLNKRLTACPDGEQHPSCHAATVDWSRLGLSPAATAELEAAV